MAARTMTSCQPQNTKAASLSEINLTWQAVSYTHLDVYKRQLGLQAQIQPPMKSNSNIAVMLPETISASPRGGFTQPLQIG